MKIIILILFLLTSFAYGQNVTTDPLHDPLQSEFNKIAIEKYGDTKFPKRDLTVRKDQAWENFYAANKEYSKQHQSFPKYQSTGSPKKDDSNYNKKIEEWFQKNPFYPQLINTGFPKEDFENYEKARREWIKRNSDKYSEICKKAYNEIFIKQNLYPLDGGKPQFIETGNKIDDNARYKKVKTEWLNKNHDKYLIEHPEENITQEELVKLRLNRKNLQKDLIK